MHIKSINTLQQHWHAFPKKPYILLCIYLFITSKLQNKHCYLDQNMFNIFGSGETPKRSEIKKKCSKPQNAKISKASFRCCGLGHFDSGHFGFRTFCPHFSWRREWCSVQFRTATANELPNKFMSPKPFWCFYHVCQIAYIWTRACPISEILDWFIY
jgi:hypothetical protein